MYDEIKSEFHTTGHWMVRMLSTNAINAANFPSHKNLTGFIVVKHHSYKKGTLGICTSDLHIVGFKELL